MPSVLRLSVILVALVYSVPGFAVRACLIEFDGGTLLLNRWVNEPARRVEQLLDVLQEIPETKVNALEFGARLSRGEFSVTPLASEYKVAARTFYETGAVSIGLDSSEFGLLLVHFYHEIVHALDADGLDRLRQKDLSQAEKNKAVFDAERKAFDAQAALVKALVRDYPCAETYFNQHQSKGNVIARNPTDAEINILYGFLAVSQLR
ncbi:MAG: hypothetical protein KDD51_07525 [Bdellovibrionales bacterium]|nr:hypothetical protein [Bdellovibrionales bacterium]